MEFQDKRFLLCSLIPEKIEQQVVDITCLKREQITFRSVGSNGVHLMGNYISQEGSDSEFEDDDSESAEEEGILEKKTPVEEKEVTTIIEPAFDDSNEYEDTSEIEEVDQDDEFDVSHVCHYLDTAFGFEEPQYNTSDRSNDTSDQNKSGSTYVDVIEASKKTTDNPVSNKPAGQAPPVKPPVSKQPLPKQLASEKTTTESSKPQEPKPKRSTEVPVIKGPRPKRISRSEARKLLEQQQQQQQQQTSEPVIIEANETEPSNNEATPKNTTRVVNSQDNSYSALNQSIMDEKGKKTSKPAARTTNSRNFVAKIPMTRTRSKSPVATRPKNPVSSSIIATRTRSKSPLAKNTLPSSVNNQGSGQDKELEAKPSNRSKRQRAKKSIEVEVIEELPVEATPVNQKNIADETALEDTRPKKKSSKSKKTTNNKPVEESIKTTTNEEKSKDSEPEVGTEETENSLSSELEERVENASIKNKKTKSKKVKTPVELVPDTVDQLDEETISQESTDVEISIPKKKKKSKSKRDQPTQPVEEEEEEEEVNGPDHQEEEPNKTNRPKKIGSKKINAATEKLIDLETEVETKPNEEKEPSGSKEEVEDRTEKLFKLGKGLERKMQDLSHFTFEELLELEKERKRQKKERKKKKREARLRKEDQSITESAAAPASTPDIVATMNADAIAAAAAARAVTTNTKKSIHAVNNKNIENLKKYPKRKASGEAAEKLGAMARADALMAQSVKRGELKRKKTKTSNLQ
ncbi:hypothetical protein BD770DRAFT_93126 [Pilaira anomala]|nr:hypothetical protein BD770DRAFT_93126 [Pilaira anomala]